VRFSYGDPGNASYAFGVVEGGDETPEQVAVIDGHPFAGISLTGVRLPFSGVRLLPPVLPSKIVAIGKNYADHAREMGGEPPAEPVMFLKPSTCVVGPGADVVAPPISDRVDYEGELAVVIGHLCRDVSVERAHEVILGYTCANDVTARDLQARDGQWSRAKGFDTFGPLGPWIETEVDVRDLELTTRVNGLVKQKARTSALMHDVPALIAAITAVMTLLPGDVILTGTPAGVGPVVPGDEMSVTIEGIGTLTNRVVAKAAA
jgi:2-keto-4-pentenoate hydratase/2-oxohepta-3-ene-1,7-dioic acid hydratase in catechol pathway